jgi:hypothetical protein
VYICYDVHTQHTYICTLTHTYTHTNVYTYTNTHTHTHTHIIYTHIHTHTHTLYLYIFQVSKVILADDEGQQHLAHGYKSTNTDAIFLLYQYRKHKY